MLSYTKPIEIKTLYNRLKSSAKRRGIPFDLTLTDLNNITFPISCPILNIPLKFNRVPMDDSYSFDRIDSTKGYTIDNVIIISLRANKLKNNANIKELSALSEFYKSSDL